MANRRNTRCKRNSRVLQSGGGAGGSVTFAPSSVGTLINNPLAYSPASNCLTATRPGFLTNFGQGHGLPGMSVMSGGRRRTRKGKKSKKSKKSRKQNGGAYSMGPYDGTALGPRGGLGPIASIACTGASQTVIPPSGAANTLNVRGGPLWDSQKGGAMTVVGSSLDAAAQPLSGQTVPIPSSAAMTVPTAGMTHLTGADSTATTSAGTKIMLHIPADGRSSGCMKGGRRRKSQRKSRKSGKSQRKSRSSRKSGRR
jgi:hypothetical protein